MIEILSVEEYSEQITQDIENQTNQATPAVPYAYNKAVADAMAAQVTVNKLHNVDQRKECFALTASEFVGLPLLAIQTNTPRGTGVKAQVKAEVTGDEGLVIGAY